MSLSIDTLKAAINKHPLLDPSKYQVQITGPNGSMDRDLLVMCSKAVIPGRGFSTVDKYHHGPIRKVPYQEIYDQAVFSFYETQDMKEKKFFDEWQAKMGGAGDFTSYFIGWYEDIIGTVTVMTLDKRGKVTSETTLYEAYPVSIGETTLSYAAGGEIPTLEVTFIYHHHEKK